MKKDFEEKDAMLARFQKLAKSINKYDPNIFVVKKSGQPFFRNAYIPKINKSTKKGI